MEKIYVLKANFESNNDYPTLIGQKGAELFSLGIEKEIKGEFYHYYLKSNNRLCEIKSEDSPLKALLNYGKFYGNMNFKISDFKLKELSIEPGLYYRRVYRPLIKKSEKNLTQNEKLKSLENRILNYPDYIPNDTILQNKCIFQMSILKDILLNIFKTIEPTPENLKAYGHNLRNLIILSCIEVESQLSGILKIHEKTKKERYTTHQFFKLKKILKLDKYTATFPSFEALGSFSPFIKWSKEQPTQSLIWYDGYNKIKHNSEDEYKQAHLKNALNSFCAIAILFYAQYGEKNELWRNEIGNFVSISDNINWKLDEKLLPPYEENIWCPQKINITYD